MKRLILSLLAGLAGTSHAQEKYAPIHRLTMDEYEGTLRFWRKQHPQWVTLQSRALSGQNLCIC